MSASTHLANVNVCSCIKLIGIEVQRRFSSQNAVFEGGESEFACVLTFEFSCGVSFEFSCGLSFEFSCGVSFAFSCGLSFEFCCGLSFEFSCGLSFDCSLGMTLVNARVGGGERGVSDSDVLLE